MKMPQAINPIMVPAISRNVCNAFPMPILDCASVMRVTYNSSGLISDNNSGTRLSSSIFLDYFTFFALCRENYCRNLLPTATSYCRIEHSTRDALNRNSKFARTAMKLLRTHDCPHLGCESLAIQIVPNRPANPKTLQSGAIVDERTMTLERSSMNYLATYLSETIGFVWLTGCLLRTRTQIAPIGRRSVTKNEPNSCILFNRLLMHSRGGK